jgi:hypothetical protein
MANAQFTKNDGSGAYVFAQNPEVPYSVKTVEHGYSRARLSNASLKIYIGVDKKEFELDFINISASQKDSLLAFYTTKAYFRFYEDSAINVYTEVWFKNPPDIQLDQNNITYTVKISLEEI